MRRSIEDMELARHRPGPAERSGGEQDLERRDAAHMLLLEGGMQRFTALFLRETGVPA
jgi:hypothetical protein